MAVLAHLGDEQAGLAAEAAADRLDALLRLRPAGIALISGAVDAADRLRQCVVAAPGLLERGADLAQRGAGAGALDGQSEEVGCSSPERGGGPRSGGGGPPLRRIRVRSSP